MQDTKEKKARKATMVTKAKKERKAEAKKEKNGVTKKATNFSWQIKFTWTNLVLENLTVRNVNSSIEVIVIK